MRSNNKTRRATGATIDFRLKLAGMWSRKDADAGNLIADNRIT
jgi:hypothetical protein